MATAAVHHAPSPVTGPSSFVEARPVETKQQAKHDVTTTMNYARDTGAPPEPVNMDNIRAFLDREKDVRTVVVKDITGEESKYTLDSHGFQIYPQASKVQDFVDEDKIKTEYYPETEQLLKDVTGAVRIHIFDHNIRRSPPKGTTDPTGLRRRPAMLVHIDQSYGGADGRLDRHFGADEAAELRKRRFQIVNVWRPIKTIYKHPLAILDANSVPDSDLVPLTLVYQDRKGETVDVLPNPDHRFYYKYAQRPDEVMLFKIFDSKLDTARRVPHSAFVDPDEEDKEARESIEIRALVFYDY